MNERMPWKSTVTDVTNEQVLAEQADKSREYTPEKISEGIYDLLVERMDIATALTKGGPDDPAFIEVNCVLNTVPRTALTVTLECPKTEFLQKLKDTLAEQIAEKNITRSASIVSLTGNLQFIKAEEANKPEKNTRLFASSHYKQIINQ